MTDSTPLPEIGSILGSVSDGKLLTVQQFIQTIRNEDVRLSLQGALRPLLRSSRPPRLFTPLRLFCLPFENLLSNRAPKIWQMGRIPRVAIVPLWKMIREQVGHRDFFADERPTGMLPARLDAEWARNPLFDMVTEALAAIRRRSLKDEAFRARGLDVCNGFWDVVAVIDDILQMRRDYVEAVPRTRSLPEGRIEPEQAEPVLAILRRAAGSSRQRLVLFMLLLAKTDGLASKVFELNRSIGGSAGSAIFNEVARILAEDLREALDQLEKRSEGQDLHELVQEFDHLGEQISRLKESSWERRDIHDLYAAYKDVLRQRFSEAADRLIQEAQRCSERGAPFPEPFAKALDALSHSGPLFTRVGLRPIYRRKAAEVMSAVQEALGRLARASTDQSPRARNQALDTVIGSTHALEPLLGTAGAVAMLRQNFAQITGAEAAVDTDKFLVQLVEMKIREEDAALKGGPK